MGIFGFFKRKNIKNQQNEINTISENIKSQVNNAYSDNNQNEIKVSKKELPKKEYPILVQETSFSRKVEEKNAFFEYINFKVAGTSHYQSDIKKAIKLEADSIFFDEKYDGMTNKEILESTFDEPIFIHHNAIFSNCDLRLEEDNEYDPEAIAVYVNNFKVGHVPRKNFKEGKKYIYDLLKSDIRYPATASLYGGKYKINRDDTSIKMGETDYKIECQLVIKTEK
ncbi:HIRAN domain-containing protein [Bacillus inaquosorum]|uniref:HIRAN domain-containing protein n=1 Tax=Bacillus inaquosorum TaxID=483913 RepID=UPI00228119BA|nr:HIRAN domain-containing protein [Bacillus inaquosorum]MCY9177518.1 HIRAN domain-containing protein [Bacillus inaquosorum]